uniref:Uncharacterized protein n=1 Tax=Arundo donax TaxID=35708 RepID=A0A0A9PPU8_ARUDO
MNQCSSPSNEHSKISSYLLQHHSSAHSPSVPALQAPCSSSSSLNCRMVAVCAPTISVLVFTKHRCVLPCERFRDI